MTELGGSGDAKLGDAKRRESRLISIKMPVDTRTILVLPIFTCWLWLKFFLDIMFSPAPFLGILVLSNLPVYYQYNRYYVPSLVFESIGVFSRKFHRPSSFS
jgi:hypothetical protein